MFAGKTTALLKRVAQEEAKGLAVALVKSSKDGRYSEDEIVSHDGTKRRCDSVTKLGDLRGIIVKIVGSKSMCSLWTRRSLFLIY